ncbi:hypothetical protein OG455_41365 [Kitasatospora sp. NBC_01287]|uniref:hypothetical protein n=1 Tax=Kitasatospora sp. NBC_01287 TaxID=2903573 RepID=UPI00224E20FB|nr:hypothetical protein [Kitasatospora sp. NBC_01287]MCX4750933.1 hypothetical protein [Kitasatospora sp. NBC_01287]MCX4751816.1 hypothetical protein [Kitasatospora sp. NBC_01287]MCX4751892.1 hypothetical protein [Kitasatospora sp. NBC_01287]
MPMFGIGDEVTVIDTEGQPTKTLGRTGRVVDTAGDELVAVAGIDHKVTEWLLGERAYRPDQLKKV